MGEALELDEAAASVLAFHLASVKLSASASV